jgi:hypothetical protein
MRIIRALDCRKAANTISGKASTVAPEPHAALSLSACCHLPAAERRARLWQEALAARTNAPAGGSLAPPLRGRRDWADSEAQRRQPSSRRTVAELALPLRPLLAAWLSGCTDHSAFLATIGSQCLTSPGNHASQHA